MKKRKKKSDWNEVPARHILEQNPELKNKLEHKHRRTQFSKTFAMGRNKKGEDEFRVINKLGECVHYKKNPEDKKEAWKDIDLTLQKVGTTYEVNKTFYDVVIYSDKVGYSYTSKRGGKIDVELVAINGQQVDYSKLTHTVTRNQIFWKGLASGLEMKLMALPQKVEIFKKLDTPTAPRKFGWKITQDLKTVATFNENTQGIDNAKAPMQITTTKSSEQIVGGRKQFIFEEEWTGLVSKVINKRKRQKDWSGTPMYPLVIDASVTENIVAGADDVYQLYTATGGYKSSALKSTRTDVRGGNYSTTGQWYAWPGFRFQSLNIPQGATITTVTMKVVSNKASRNSPKLNFYADNVDDATAWTVGNPKTITKTTAKTLWGWTAASAGITLSAGFTSVVQEIISRVGWISGNNIKFAGFSSNSLAIGYVQAYEKAGGTPASLVVDYTVPVTPQNAPFFGCAF